MTSGGIAAVVIAQSDIQWGTVGQWMGGMLGAFLAALVAIGLFAAERRHDRRRAELADLDETRRLLVIARGAREGDDLSVIRGTVSHALSRHSEIADFNVASQALRRPWDSQRKIDEWISLIDARLLAAKVRLHWWQFWKKKGNE